MYVSVPTKVLALAIVLSISRTMPKSEILTAPWWLMSRLLGLMSR